MPALTDTKAALAASLRDAGYPVKDHVPRSVAPPVIILGAGDPYVEEGDTFNPSQMKVNLEAFLLVAPGSNADEVRDLDRMLEAVLPHVGDWTAAVAQPEIYTVNQSRYLGLRIALSNLFDLG